MSSTQNTVTAVASQSAQLLAKENERRLLAGTEGMMVLCYLADSVNKGPDFALTKSEEEVTRKEGTIKFRHPESFKACFAEISFALEASLTQAYLTMDYLKKALPEIMKSMSKIDNLFAKNDTKKMEKLLTIYVRAPDTLAAESNGKVQITIEKFDYAVQILEEILVRGRATQGITENSVEEMTSKIQSLELQKGHHEKMLQESTSELNETKVKTSIAEKELDESVKNMDSLWTSIKSGISLKSKAEKKLEKWEILEKKKETLAKQLADLEKKTLNEKVERHEVIKNLTKLTTEKQTKEQTLKSIEAGLKYLQQMRTQWTGLRTCFEEFENTFKTKFQEQMKDYMSIAKEGEPELLEELKESANEVSIGCVSMSSFAVQYTHVHLKYLTPMMLAFPKFCSSEVDDESRANLQILMSDAEKNLQQAAIEDKRHLEVSIGNRITEL